MTHDVLESTDLMSGRRELRVAASAFGVRMAALVGGPAPGTLVVGLDAAGAPDRVMLEVAASRWPFVRLDAQGDSPLRRLAARADWPVPEAALVAAPVPTLALTFALAPAPLAALAGLDPARLGWGLTLDQLEALAAPASYVLEGVTIDAEAAVG